MNGATFAEDCGPADKRPIITCAGELEVFSAIEDALSQALPQDSCEWRRSLGRSVRSVYIGATFTPFSSAGLPKNSQWDLIRQPLFHIYWTECNDVDVYKATIRDDIESWLKELTSRDIPDWLIVVVENYDGKRSNKLLPRTTVLDKVRADFAPKQGDRCISVINPSRVEARSADSWRGLVGRIRHLLLVGYARAVAKLEDHVRQQREKRNEPGWNFMAYFKLQEELAQVLEMLKLYDEALVQYDELDALFSQFVVNGQSGDVVHWLAEFQRPLERWHGLKLGPCVLHDEPSLLKLRAYLYAKQAHMLLLIKKIWEVASRCLPFLHTCTRELALLEISSPQGAVACWLFLACMEVLQSCDKHNQADQIEAYSLHTASLWAYASQKIRYLGELCGLMPGTTPSSDQLHAVVYLSAGMGDNPGAANSPSPTDKLKQALCSQTAFNKTYLELAELAVGTYKHIGRLRSARLVGREVASFYLLLGELQKSAAFLGDALRTFEQDNWRELAAQTQIELAECFKKSKDIRKYIRSCAAISAAPEIDNLIRWSYFDEMRKSLDSLDRTLIVPFKDIVRIASARVRNEGGTVMQDEEITVELAVCSNFPREIVCDRVMLSVETDVKEAKKGRRSSNVITGKDLKQADVSLQRLRIQRHLDYKQDKQLASASVVCRNAPLKRADSNAAPPYHSEFNEYLETAQAPLVLTPGVNLIRLSRVEKEVGKFYLGQVAIHIRLMELISISLSPRLSFEVRREEPTVRLDKGKDDLLAGIEQIMHLSVTIGSYSIPTKSTIKLAASIGLSIQRADETDSSLTNNLEIVLEQTSPYACTQVPIRVLAELPSKDHQVTITCPWSNKPLSVSLSFTPPLTTSWRLHTVKHRKYVQISITGICEQPLTIANAALSIGGTNAVPFNQSSSHSIMNGLSVSFTYELMVKPSSESPKLKGDFSLQYALGSTSEEDGPLKTYHYYFEISEYQTLYHVEAAVEPTKGSEFCRVGALCHLQLMIRQAGHTLQTGTSSLMYEVVAEQSVWAVCGRTAGVISFESDEEPQSVVMDVMPLNSGYLPLPLVRLSKYIPADYGLTGDQHPRLEAFTPGQVYNASKGRQVHVINSTADGHVSIA